MKLLQLVVGLSTFAVLIISVYAHSQTPNAMRSKFRVMESVALKARPFSLQEVKLLDGPFKTAMEVNQKWLLELQPDKMMAGFREQSGLKPKAEKYWGWESTGIAGHCPGHYLSACAMMYASTGDKRFRDKVDYMIDELDECQKAIGTGYVAATPDGKRIFGEVAARNVRSAGFDLNGGWVPWYSEHKVFAGIRDAYLYCNSQKAKTVLINFADWVYDTTKNLNEDEFQRMLACEHGGMNETLADIYTITGNKKYLDLALKFNHKAILDPLSKREDRLTGKHANTQIPKIIGCAREYEVTGDSGLLTTASYFWDVVTRERSFVIGGNSTGEHFRPKEELSKSIESNTCETCNTYNMLKLTRHLFCLEPKAEYANYYERALYNHILASQHPKTGRVTYFVGLKTGDTRRFVDAFECCVGTGWENHAKYGESIYFHDGNKTLYVNLYIASELNWKNNGLKLRQETSYPQQGRSKFIFTCTKPINMAMKLNHPSWATLGLEISINGKKQINKSIPGSFATIARRWKTGDVVTVDIPMPIYTEGFKDNPDKQAILYGPLVLCTEVESGSGYPVLVADQKKIASAIKPVKGRPLTFEMSASVTKKLGGHTGNVTLIPFYQQYEKPYMVYWDVFSSEQWAKEENNYKEEQKLAAERAANTVDEMRFEMQMERDHNLKSENSHAGDLTYKNKVYKWRDALDGWFSFDMKVDPSKPTDLLVTYWGRDAGNRDFDILLDDVKIASVSLNGDKGEKLYDVAYPIPAEMLTGKDKVTVKFQSAPGKVAGGVFGCAMFIRK